MKPWLPGTILTLTLLFSTACNDKDSDKNYLRLNPQQDISFPAEVGTVTITIDTDAPDWDAKLKAGDWFKVDKSADSFTVSAPLNSSDDSKHDEITVTAGNAAPVIISVTQQPRSGPKNSLSADPDDDILFTYQATRVILNITTDATEWNATLTYGDWFLVETDPEENTLSIISRLNDTDKDKTDVLTISAGNADPIVLNITQTKRTAFQGMVDNELLLFAASGAPSQTITVNAGNAQWDFIIDTIGRWVSAVKVAGGIQVTVPDNTGRIRNGAISVMIDGHNPVYVPVIQQSQYNGSSWVMKQWYAAGFGMMNSLLAPYRFEWNWDTNITRDQAGYFVSDNYGNSANIAPFYENLPLYLDEVDIDGVRSIIMPIGADIQGLFYEWEDEDRGIPKNEYPITQALAYNHYGSIRVYYNTFLKAFTNGNTAISLAMNGASGEPAYPILMIKNIPGNEFQQPFIAYFRDGIINLTFTDAPPVRGSAPSYPEAELFPGGEHCVLEIDGIASMQFDPARFVRK